MAIIIDFKEKLKEKIESKKISLSTFKLTEEDVDIIKLYHYIDEKYKIKLNTTSGKIQDFIRCQGKRELFEELTRVSKDFESERVAWIVLDTKTDYVYIKELDKIYKAEKGIFEQEIKKHMYEYSIDYLLILEKISIDTYRWITA